MIERKCLPDKWHARLICGCGERVTDEAKRIDMTSILFNSDIVRLCDEKGRFLSGGAFYELSKVVYWIEDDACDFLEKEHRFSF